MSTNDQINDGKTAVTLDGLRNLASVAKTNGTTELFVDVVLEWAALANGEIVRLRAALATRQAVQGEPVKNLVEAVDTLLDEAPCKCPHKMRFDDGEHYSGCYLFDLNVARTALLATPPAPGQVKRDREDAERWQMRFEALHALYEYRPGIEELDTAIRAARSSEGGAA